MINCTALVNTPLKSLFIYYNCIIRLEHVDMLLFLHYYTIIMNFDFSDLDTCFFHSVAL